MSGAGTSPNEWNGGGQQAGHHVGQTFWSCCNGNPPSHATGCAYFVNPLSSESEKFFAHLNNGGEIYVNGNGLGDFLIKVLHPKAGE